MPETVASPVSAEGLRPDPPPPSRLFVLKQADTFVVTDAYGDIDGNGNGLFHDDTRILSMLKLRIRGERPTLLNTAHSRDNALLTSHMVNKPLGDRGPVGTVHLRRSKVLSNSGLMERLLCTNFGTTAVVLPLTLRYGADFADIFEVRGLHRARRGRRDAPEFADGAVVLGYTGLDLVRRRTTISFSEEPVALEGDRAEFEIRIEPGEVRDLYFEFSAGKAGHPSRMRYRREAAAACRLLRARYRRGARLHSSSRLFNAWIQRSRADLALLTTDLETGPYPYAGIPWFSTTFGRDAIITALQTLWLDPALSKGVLAYLASTQAGETSAFRDSAPGKILHETRKGEMGALGEVPFGRYYGGVDTTPLFLVLAGAYWDRTGDRGTIDALWPALLAALSWIERTIDSSALGLLTYARGKDTGLANQGWKDSEDSIFHADGRMVHGPVALVEVQGYAFAAFRAMARLAGERGDPVSAGAWSLRAENLRRGVERHFWMEDEGFYGIAIDGENRLCRVCASNPGHLLYVGLPSHDRARRVVQRLLSSELDSGWGVRTLGSRQANFNPMAYHNGSVWPHDTAICAAGAARYGERGGAVRLMNQIFETAVSFKMRLPELYCGFARMPGEPPISYPVACLPQAWAAGAPLMMLQGCLGLRIDGARQEIHVDRPYLPTSVDRLFVRDLAFGDRTITLQFERVGDRVAAVPHASDGHEVPVFVQI
ncbi:MAG: amylo-alpha-1,6-glucosidase [Alphaproteobacteria bacterium]|nr:amylo-alpha-1,6-glucosidase [Alphaproteobacteria bacterium]